MTNKDNSLPVCNQKYQKTKWEWNSNVCDVYLDYDKIPSNLKITVNEDINAILERTLPASKHGYLNLTKTIPKYYLKLKGEYTLK
jgi:hypothetical protein